MNRSQKASQVEIPGPPSKPTTDLLEDEHAHLDVEGAIRRRAYELYEERGMEDGHSEEDWLRAEAEVTAGLARTKDTAPPE
jgi:hypothetical protein